MWPLEHHFVVVLAIAEEVPAPEQLCVPLILLIALAHGRTPINRFTHVTPPCAVALALVIPVVVFMASGTPALALALVILLLALSTPPLQRRPLGSRPHGRAGVRARTTTKNDVPGDHRPSAFCTLILVLRKHSVELAL